MLNCNNKIRNFNALKAHINGREFDLAQQILGLTDGNKQNDSEHHQPCPIPGCASDDDGFYVREDNGTFHCRRCGFNGDIIDLVAAVRGISKTESFDIIVATCGLQTVVFTEQIGIDTKPACVSTKRTCQASVSHVATDHRSPVVASR